MFSGKAQESRRRAAMALFFYSVAALVLSAPLPLHFGSTVARAVRPDVWLNVWALSWTSEHLLGFRSLFDANIFFPHANTLAYTDHFIGQSLIAAPFYWLSGSPQVAYNVAWYAALILTGWGGYLWVRCLIGDQPGGEAAALVAGAVCLFVPAKRTTLSHLQVMSLQGVTFSLFALHALLKRPVWTRALALCAAVLFGALCSWYTAAYLGLLLAALIPVALLLPEQTASRSRAAGWSIVALFLVAMLMLPVSTPYRSVQQEMQMTRPIEELVETSIRPIDLVSSWSWLHTGWMPAGSQEGSGYFPGFVATVLGLIGIWGARRRDDRWPLVYGVAACGFALLALGPRLGLSDAIDITLPYAALYRFVPGFGALRNPYRAAFIATLLFAVPVGYGARDVIEAFRARLMLGERWRARPRRKRLAVATWLVAGCLATLHLFEAWPGPQRIEALPEPPSGAYAWLARQVGSQAAFVWPLPRPFDDNARYQLWTVGGWASLVNGHSGLYPAEFLRMYEAPGDFPDASFLDALKQGFPVGFVVAHYGLAGDGDARRARAAESTQLREVWSEGDDVIYRISNGAGAGWLRRRLPSSMVGERLEVRSTEAAAGCDLRAAIDGEIIADRRLGTGQAGGAGVDAVSYIVDSSREGGSDGFVRFDLYLADPEAGPRVDLHAAIGEGAGAWIELNGERLAAAPMVAASIRAETGMLTAWRAAEASQESAAAALQAVLGASGPGDRVAVALAEEFDLTLIERLRLLLDVAGAAEPDDRLTDSGAAYVFLGVVGSPPGTAEEVLGASEADLEATDRNGDCRLSPLLSFSWLEAAAGPRGQPVPR